MKKFFLYLFSFILFSFITKAQTQTLHDFSAETILGDTLDLSTLTGKKVLVVNTASFCGYTYEYGLLEDLYELYGGENFEILGFPSDDFFQEYDDDSSIYDFCLNVYGIAFQMMSKTHVKGNDICEVYDWLTHASQNGVADAPVLWNFQKFAVDEAGHWVTWFPTAMSPLDTSIVNWILSPSVIETSVPTPEVMKNQIKIYQGENMEVEYYSQNPGQVFFIFTDVAGRKIISKDFLATAGINRFEFEVPSSGIYMATTIADGKTISQKIVVAR